MYQPQAETQLIKLTKQCVNDSERWFGDSGTAGGVHGIIHHSLAMAGEVGEFCNIVKKIDRGSLSINDAVTRNQLAMELTDVFVYVLNLAGLLGVDLSKTYDVVRSNNEKRFMQQRSERESRRG